MRMLAAGVALGAVLRNAVALGAGWEPGWLLPEIAWALRSGLLQTATYGLFLAGAVLCRWRSGWAALLLLGGLAGRAVLELRFSPARLWFDRGEVPGAADAGMLAVFYLLSFLLPALLCIDCARGWRRKRKEIIHHPSSNHPSDGGLRPGGGRSA